MTKEAADKIARAATRSRAMVYSNLREDSWLSVEDVARYSRYRPYAVLNILTELEKDGLAKRGEGSKWRRLRLNL